MVREDGADEPIIKRPPLLCLEVLSPRDTLTAMRHRIQDYFDMGVPEIWIFDPQTQIAFVCTAGSVTERMEGMLHLEGTGIELSIAEIFKPLKRKPSENK